MNKTQSCPLVCSLCYLRYLYVPLLRVLSLRIFTRSRVALRTVKSFRKCFRTFDSTFSSNDLKNFKIQFSELFSNCWPEFSESLKFDRETGEFGLFEFEKIRSFNIEPLLFILSRPMKIPLASSSHTTGCYFLFAPNSREGKKEKQASREFRGSCGEPVEFSSVKSLSGLRFRCAFCGPATSCQT